MEAGCMSRFLLGFILKFKTVSLPGCSNYTVAYLETIT